jgi:hypothetical protein
MARTSELVVVSTFSSIADALIAKGILDEIGIESSGPTTRAVPLPAPPHSSNQALKART